MPCALCGFFYHEGHKDSAMPCALCGFFYHEGHKDSAMPCALCGFFTTKDTKTAQCLVPFVVFLPRSPQRQRNALCPLWFFYHEAHKDSALPCVLCGFFTTKATKTAQYLVAFVVFLPQRPQRQRNALCPLWFFYHKGHKDSAMPCALCGFFTTKATKKAQCLVPFVVFLPQRPQRKRNALCPLWFFYHEAHKDSAMPCALCGFFTTKATKTAQYLVAFVVFSPQRTQRQRNALCPLWFFYHKGHKESAMPCALCGFFTTKDTKKAQCLVPFVVFLPQRTQRQRNTLCPLWFFYHKGHKDSALPCDLCGFFTTKDTKKAAVLIA
jgi:hypothetical protein